MADKPRTTERLRTLAPDIWELVRPRRGLLALRFVPMGREAALVGRL